MARNVDEIRNLAVCGHGSAGKTTLVDQLLVKTGAVTGQPSVDNGTSICDFDEEEKHHKHSVEASIVHFDHAGLRFNVIDTPGYPDLIGQTVGALRAVETALIAIDAHAGIKVNTRRAWKEAGDAGIGRILCITKLDTDNINFPGLIDSIKEVFGSQCALFNVPIGHGHDLKGVVSTLDVPKDTAGALIDPTTLSESVVESIIEADEAVMEKYLEGEMPSKEVLQRLCAEAVRQGTLTPIVCVSTKMGIGLDELLAVLTQAALPPTAVVRTAKKDGDDGDAQVRSERTAGRAGVQDANRPVRAAAELHSRVLRHVEERQHGAFVRGTQGRQDRAAAFGAGRENDARRHGNRRRHRGGCQDRGFPHGHVARRGRAAADQIPDADGWPGRGAEDSRRRDQAFRRPPQDYRGGSNRSARSRPGNEGDGPHRHERVAPATACASGSSAATRSRSKRTSRKFPYRETIQTNAEGSYRHKKQSGGSGQFGEVHIRMYPFPEGTKPEDFTTKERFPHLKNTHFHEKNNFLWVDTVVGGTIPGNFMPAIEKGFLEKIATGVVAGYPVQNICVEVHFGKDHPVDSNETAFRIAGRQCVCERVPRSAAKPAGTDRENAHHGSGRQRGRRIERSLGPPRPNGRHGLGRRRHDDRRSDLPAV